MRVLHLDSGRSMRGGQWQALYLMKEQKRNGLQPLLLARKSGALYSIAREEGIPTAALSWLAVRKVSAECAVAHCHDARSHGYAAVAARCPFVVARRVAFPVRGGLASRWKYRRAAHYIAVSRCAAAELIRARVPETAITVVYDAVLFPEDPGSRTGDWAAVDLDDPRKGRELIEAAAVRAGVTIAWTRDLPESMATARGFVYISDSEGLGSAALVAMAFGVPVIASRVGGLPEIVHDGDTGLLVDNDPAAIALAIRRIEEDTALASRLSRDSRAYAMRHHSFAALETATRAVYRKVIPT